MVLTVIAALLAGLVMMPKADTALQAASDTGYRQLEGVEVDYEKYLDNSVMYRLPAGIRDDEEISVIITLDQINLMDAYEGTDKSMSFADYALSSNDAEALRASITAEQAKVLAKLDEQGKQIPDGDTTTPPMKPETALNSALGDRTTVNPFN